MKKTVPCILLALISLLPGRCLADDEGYDKFLNLLGAVPGFFENLLNRSGEIARRQDRKKLASIGKDMYIRLDAVILEKQQLISMLEDTVRQFDNHATIRLVRKVRDVASSVAEADALTRKIGIDAIVLARALEADLNAKTLMLTEVGQSQPGAWGNRRLIAARKLRDGQAILNAAKGYLGEFIRKMEG